MRDSVIAASGNNGRATEGVGGDGGMGVWCIPVNAGAAVGHKAFRLLCNDGFDTRQCRRKKPSIQFLFVTDRRMCCRPGKLLAICGRNERPGM